MMIRVEMHWINLLLQFWKKEEGFHIGSFITIFAQTPESWQFLYLYDKAYKLGDINGFL